MQEREDSRESPLPATSPRVTTVADSGLRADIEPYSAHSSAHVAEGLIGCVFCAGTKFRRSRIRFQDMREILMLRYPMRCMRCNQRQYGFFLTAAFAHAPRSQSGRIARGHETWQAWTGSEMDKETRQRPMTTSIGTRATKLQKVPDSQTTPRP